MHWPFACFSAALLFFHCSEAALAYAFNPQDAGWHSTCLGKCQACCVLSLALRIARLALQLAVCSCHGSSLHGVRARVAAGTACQGTSSTHLKLAAQRRAWAYAAVQGAPSLQPVQWLGLLLVVFGEALRKAGILTARSNFTHVVQLTRRPGHTLVTHGVYAFVRHPGYLGWFIWSVSTQARGRRSLRCGAFGQASSVPSPSQLLLLNPVCTLGFAAASRLYVPRCGSAPFFAYLE